MIQGTYYKEWSSVLNREMEFKVYGSAGVPVLAMHSPFEVIHKTDLYMAYRTFSLFCQSAD